MRPRIAPTQELPGQKGLAGFTSTEQIITCSTRPSSSPSHGQVLPFPLTPPIPVQAPIPFQEPPPAPRAPQPRAHARLRSARGRRGSGAGGRRVRRRVRAGGGAVGMSRYGRYGGETKVYVGNLGTGAGKGELERAFSYYGPLRTVWIARNPPGFAFVEFEDPRDAEDAVRGLDGKVICGSRVRVEVSTGMPRRSRYDRPPARRPFDPNDRCYECGEKGHYAYDCHRYSRRRRSRFLRLSQSP
uniref:Serine and arginine rich splicing factor 7 n=1 Tax=Corvus moneduloides TaxID=1196302 RepID=A0A8C3D9S3_CORMO